MAGCTFMEALHDKYDPADTQLHIRIAKSAPGKSDSGKLRVPEQLALDRRDICAAGTCDEIRQNCSHIRELDLTRNMLQEWAEVFSIIGELPQLYFLNLSHNPLSKSTPPSSPKNVYPSINKLVLNGTNVPYIHIQSLLNVMPKLNELHLSLNNYSTVEFEGCYNNIQQVYINANMLTHGEGLVKLGSIFPSLIQLVMIENPLAELGPILDLVQVLGNLSKLNITDTKIASWEELEKLRHLPSLTDLRLKGISVLQGLPEKDGRNMVIAYLPNIEHLNGSPVLPTEREDAERAFIRQFMESNDKPGRYHELKEKYGNLDPLAEVNLIPDKHVRVSVQFENRKQEVVCDTTLTVIDFKKRLKDFVGHPPSKFRLYYIDQDGWQGADELKYPNRSLFAIGVKNDDKFEIDLKM